VPELRGRIDRDKLNRWLDAHLAPNKVDEWFLCGPIELVTDVRCALLDRGVDAEHIHLELFTGYAKPAEPTTSHPGADLSFHLSGTEQTTQLQAGETILEAALQVDPDTPYACMGRARGTCKAKLVDGTAEMDQNFALGKSDLEAGYILTCQARPTSPAVTVDYDG